MERARKWVMIPAESESNGEPHVQIEKGISAADLIDALKLANSGFVNNSGVLLDIKKKKPIIGSSLFSCLTQKSKAKYYNKFLEMKAQLSRTKNASKCNKRKKSVSDWSEDEE